MKKVLGHSLHLLNDVKLLKDSKFKARKLPHRIAIMDSPTVAGLDQVVNMHRVPVKVEYPSTSDLLMLDEYRQTISSSPKRSRGRPRNEFSPKIIKSDGDTKTGGERTGKRRGRPIKNKSVTSKVVFCGLCNFRGEHVYDLDEHLKTHPNQSIYECPYCNSIFSQKGNLITHIRTHTKEKPFKCLMCDFAASQKINLQVHIRTHTKEKPFKCSNCDFSTAQKCNLISHVTRRHSNVEVVKALETYENQWGNNDTQLKFYRCGLCVFTSKLKKEMLDHVKTHHPFDSCGFQPFESEN